MKPVRDPNLVRPKSTGAHFRPELVYRALHRASLRSQYPPGSRLPSEPPGSRLPSEPPGSRLLSEPPGSRLPSEHEPAPRRGVNRGSAREALQRSEQLRLIEIQARELLRVASAPATNDDEDLFLIQQLGELISNASRTLVLCMASNALRSSFEQRFP